VSACAKKAGAAQRREELFAELPAAVTSTLDAPFRALATSVWVTVNADSLPATAEMAITAALGDFARVHVAVLAQESTDPAIVNEWTNGRADREADEVCRRAVAALGLGA